MGAYVGHRPRHLLFIISISCVPLSGSFAGESIEEELLADLASLQRLIDTDPVRSTLGLLLSAPELDALRRRIRELLTSRQYPSPPIHQRNYPWPPI